MVKIGYYGNNSLSLAWDRMEVCQMNLFITTNGPKILAWNFEYI